MHLLLPHSSLPRAAPQGAAYSRVVVGTTRHSEGVWFGEISSTPAETGSPEAAGEGLTGPFFDRTKPFDRQGEGALPHGSVLDREVVWLPRAYVGSPSIRSRTCTGTGSQTPRMARLPCILSTLWLMNRRAC